MLVFHAITRARWVLTAVSLVMLLCANGTTARADAMLIDDFADADLVSALSTRWRGVSDQVMGGLRQDNVNARFED